MQPNSSGSACSRTQANRPGRTQLRAGESSCEHGVYPEKTLLAGLFNPRCRSLLRGSLLTLLSLPVAMLLSHFPQNRPTPLLVFPALTSVVGTLEHVRCMRTRWSFYHGGVLLCIYMDLMVVSMILFFLIFPYATWLSATH